MGFGFQFFTTSIVNYCLTDSVVPTKFYIGYRYHSMKHIK